MIASSTRLALAACLLIAALTPAAAAAAPNPKLDHPYLFFRGGELEKIRQRFDQPPQSYYLETLLSKAEAGDRADEQLWAYLLTGKRDYRDKALAWAKGEWARNDFSPQWIGFKVMTMAMVYDTLHPELNPEARRRMKGYLERALEAHLKKMGSWLYNNPSNTVPTQAGTAGMAALALIGESPGAADAADATRKKLARYARRCFSEDGGYIEGTLYWSFGVSFYLAYAHADHNTTGNDDLLNAANLPQQHRFAEVMLGGDGQFMPFNDSQPWLSAWPVCVDLGRRHGNELLLWLADHMAAVSAGKIDAPKLHVGHNYSALTYIMMTQGKPGPKRKPSRPFPGVPTLTHLDRMQWGVMRSSGDYIPDLVVGVKGSRGELSHHKQKDLGSFMLYAGGEMLLLDPGYYQADADDHSLPLINGKGPDVNGSRIVEAWEAGPWRTMVVDSTEAYGRIARRVRRTLVMHDDRALVLLDDIIPGDGAVREPKTMPGWSPPPINVDPEAIKATAQYQAAGAAKVDADLGDAVVNGREMSLGLWTFGPALELSVKDRDFGKSWLFRRRAQEGMYDWHSLTGDYTLEADKPLVTVLIPAAKGRRPDPPTFEREGETITVTLPNGAKVTFAKQDDKWTILRPSPPREAPQ